MVIGLSLALLGFSIYCVADISSTLDKLDTSTEADNSSTYTAQELDLVYDQLEGFDMNFAMDIKVVKKT